MNKQENWYQQD